MDAIKELGIAYKLYFTYKCFLPTICASSHIGLKEKDVIASRREETAAPVETPEHEPTPEGNARSYTPVWRNTG